MKLWKALTLALLLVLSVAMAQDQEPKHGGVLVVGQDFGPQSLDPAKTQAWASVNIFEVIYDTLLRWSVDMELEPSLAESYEVSSDNLTYTFHLRDNAVFHNGRPMTADDVKFSVERVLDPAINSPSAAALAPIESIEVVDDYTVVIKTAGPYAPLLAHLATPNTSAIVPSEAVDQLQTHPIGTGPFRFVVHELNEQVLLERHDKYWEADLPYLDQVEFRLLGDESSIMAALRSGRVDMAWMKDPTVAQALARSSRRLVSAPGQPSRYIDIKFNVKQPPFNDVRVRRAFSLATDRQALVDTILAGAGDVGTMIVQEGFKYPNPTELPYYQRDVERARELLAEAGYPDGITIDAYEVVAANNLDVQAAELLRNQWLEAGIDVTIAPTEVGQILEDWQGGNYQMVSVGVTWSADPSYWTTLQLHSSTNFAQNQGIDDPEIDLLLDTAAATVDPEARAQLYFELQEYLASQVYNIVTYTYPLRWELFGEHVQGYDVMASNARLSLRKTWLDE
jgi:peptide/nickel transport system substrate-binding protein